MAAESPDRVDLESDDTSQRDASVSSEDVFASSEDAQTPGILPYSQAFHPPVSHVWYVRRCLEQRLPPELAIAVVGLGYSPWLVTRRGESQEYRANDFWEPGPRASVAGLYLSSKPVPTDAGWVVPQRVVFQTRAADQGWATFGGNGTFENSHTWFEASILRPSGDRVPDVALEHDHVLSRRWQNVESARQALRDKGWDYVEAEDGRLTWRVCNNITARRNYRDYKVEWQRGVRTEVDDERALGRGEGFLERLKPGSMVVLWARAEEQAWVHYVAGATIEIEYRLP